MIRKSNSWSILKLSGFSPSDLEFCPETVESILFCFTLSTTSNLFFFSECKTYRLESHLTNTTLTCGESSIVTPFIYFSRHILEEFVDAGVSQHFDHILELLIACKNVSQLHLLSKRKDELISQEWNAIHAYRTKLTSVTWSLRIAFSSLASKVLYRSEFK